MHQGNETFIDYAVHKDPPPAKGAGGRSTSQSVIFFKNLMPNALNWVFVACLGVVLDMAIGFR